MNKIPETEIQYWVNRLRTVLPAHAVEDEVAGVRPHGATRTRAKSLKSGLPRRQSLKLRQVIEALKLEPPAVRRAVLFSLGQLGDDRAVDVLHLFLERNVANEVRCEALDALGKIGGPHAQSLLTHVVAEDPEPHIRTLALNNLEKLRDKTNLAKAARQKG